MKLLIASLLLVAVSVNGQDNNATTGNSFVCFQGTRVFVNGKVVYDDSSAANCNMTEDSCAIYHTIVQTPENYIAISETGGCVNSAYRANYTCDEVAKFIPANETLLNCSVEFCDGFACNKLKAPMSCQKTPENDIQILPNCTLREALTKTMKCIEPLFAGYPYTNQMMCKQNLNHVIGCMSDAAVECVSGSCPTVLDEIPNLRHIYRGVAAEAGKYRDLESILKMFAVDDKTKTMIYNAICPVPGEVPSLPDMSDINMGDMGMMFEIPFCEEDYMKELMKVQMEAVKAFYNAESRSDICMAFAMLGIKTDQLWRSKCSVEKMQEFLMSVFTGPNAKYVDLIMKGMEIMYDFFSKVRLPNCGMESMSMPCDKFHQSGRACDMRKGWMCDYVHWKISFFNDWMEKIIEWKKNNMMIDMPDDMEQQECHLGWSDHLCVDDNQMRCVSAAGGCPLCFCMDHEYTDMANVANMWRKDYKVWYSIMQKYKAAFNNDMC